MLHVHTDTCVYIDRRYKKNNNTFTPYTNTATYKVARPTSRVDTLSEDVVFEIRIYGNYITTGRFCFLLDNYFHS